MRTIKRDIVGAFIFSDDGNMILGHNGPGGVYADCWVIPGGGIELNETQLKAVQRETLEEVGIDISEASVSEIDIALTGSSTKTLKDSGETVNVEMTFFNFKVEIPLPAVEIPLKLEDDFASAEWVHLTNLSGMKFSPSVETVLKHLKLI